MTSTLLDALSSHASGAAVLVTGSAAEYGMAHSERLAEGDEIAPLTSYGAIKALLERLVLLDPLAPGLRVLATRSFNHLGPGQGPGAAVGSWVRQIASAERDGGGALVTGRLDVVRDLLDVRDVAEAYVALLAAGATGVVNVCSGTGVTMREVAERLIGLATVPVDLQVDDRFLRDIDPPTVVGDPTRLRRLTGLTPARSLDESLRDALEEQRAAPVTAQPPSSRP
jgi:GDP-4-dehydro-6-deoxy-D-mannose reductase